MVSNDLTLDLILAVSAACTMPVSKGAEGMISA